MGNAKQDYSRKPKSNRKSGGEEHLAKVPFGQGRFVRLELTESEKDEFRELHGSGELGEFDHDHWLQAGYKLSSSYDVRNKATVVSLTQQYAGMDNAGLTLTGRGGTYDKALSVLQYKLVYLVGDELWAAIEAQRGGSYGDIG